VLSKKRWTISVSLAMAAMDLDQDPATSETFLGRLYRISAPGCELVYVGSTKTTLAARLCYHRRDYRGFLRGKYPYVSSFHVLEHPGATIDLLEESEFHDMQQFREREAYWIQRLPSCNRNTPGRSASASQKISNAVIVPCRTCGRFVRRGAIGPHRQTRLCMMAAFKQSQLSSTSRETATKPCTPLTPLTSQQSCPTSLSSSSQSLS
jgi:hypothetical protein